MHWLFWINQGCFFFVKKPILEVVVLVVFHHCMWTTLNNGWCINVWLMFCSRKYKLFSIEGFSLIFTPTPPSGNFKLVPTFLLKFWLLRPSSLEFPITFPQVGMDIFWNHTKLCNLADLTNSTQMLFKICCLKTATVMIAHLILDS